MTTFIVAVVALAGGYVAGAVTWPLIRQWLTALAERIGAFLGGRL